MAAPPTISGGAQSSGPAIMYTANTVILMAGGLAFMLSISLA